MTFDARSPAKIAATGAANVSEVDHRSAGPAQGLRRTLNGNEITMNFAPGTVPVGSPKGTRPKSILPISACGGWSEGAGRFMERAVNYAGPRGAPQLKTSQVAADDLLGEFVEGARGEAELKSLHGRGDTQLQQDTFGGCGTGEHGRLAGGSTDDAARRCGIQLAN